MITGYCKFCPNKILEGFLCRGCPYQYLLLSRGDGWKFKTDQFTIDVFHDYSHVYALDVDINGHHKLIRTFQWQILPEDNVEEEIKIYLAFS